MNQHGHTFKYKELNLLHNKKPFSYIENFMEKTVRLNKNKTKKNALFEG